MHCELKAREAIYRKVQEYENAETCKIQAATLALFEKQMHDEKVTKLVDG